MVPSRLVRRLVVGDCRLAVDSLASWKTLSKVPPVSRRGRTKTLRTSTCSLLPVIRAHRLGVATLLMVSGLEFNLERRIRSRRLDWPPTHFAEVHIYRPQMLRLIICAPIGGDDADMIGRR